MNLVLSFLLRRLRFRIGLGMLLLSLLGAQRLCAQSGTVSTVLGPTLQVTGSTPRSLKPMAVALDAAGNLYTADINNCVVWETTFSAGAGTTTLFAGEVGNCGMQGTVSPVPTSNSLAGPDALAVCSGHVYIATFEGPVYEVDTNNNDTFTDLGLKATHSYSAPLSPIALACSTDSNMVDHVWVSSFWFLTVTGDPDEMEGELDGLTPNSGGGWTTTGAKLELPLTVYSAIAVNPVDGLLYGLSTDVDGFLSWSFPQALKAGSPSKILNPNSGSVIDAGVGKIAFDGGSGLAFTANGEFLISQAPIPTNGTIPATVSAQVVKVIYGTGGSSLVNDFAGNGTAGFVDDVPGAEAELNGPQGLAVDASGDVYIADTLNNRVRGVHPLAAGPVALNVVVPNPPQQASIYRYQQSALNPVSGLFYYVAGPNIVNEIATGGNYGAAGYERIGGVILVGASHLGAAEISLIADPTQDVTYASNAYDGNLYAIWATADNEGGYVTGSVALNNPGAHVMAIDPGLDRIYVGGPNASSISVVQGGMYPKLLGNLGPPASNVSSISVDPGTHTVYAVSNSGAGPSGQEESLITIAYDATTNTQSVSSQIFPSAETIAAPNFIGNSLSVDPVTGSLLAAGASSFNPNFSQSYDLEDFYTLPQTDYSLISLAYPPITTSLDASNRNLYITDFDGNFFDPSSNAAQVTGLDSQTLSATAIPVFGSTTPASPHVYDIEPDTGTNQAWISGSDASEGGFVKVWDVLSQEIILSATIPNNGGGFLSVDPIAQVAYLMDDVNGLVYLFNTPPWTPTPNPTFSQNGDNVTITAIDPADLIVCDTLGHPAGENIVADTFCTGACQLALGPGTTIIHAAELNTSTPGNPFLASDDIVGIFTALPGTSTEIEVAPNPAYFKELVTLTATVTPKSGKTPPTGSVVFKDGTTTLGKGSLNASGAATFATSSLSEGTHVITAMFGGDSTFSGSTSMGLSVTVDARPGMKFSTTAIVFPRTAVGDSSASTALKVSNLGPGSFEIEKIALTGTNAKAFVIKLDGCPKSLLKDASCTVELRFAPKSPGLLKAGLSFTDNAVDSPQTVVLSGTGFNGPAATPSPASLSFAETAVGATSAWQTVTVANTGNAALTIGSITVAGTDASSFKQTHVCAATLEANHSCAIKVQFAPHAKGALSAHILVSDNVSAVGDKLEIPLSGTGK